MPRITTRGPATHITLANAGRDLYFNALISENPNLWLLPLILIYLAAFQAIEKDPDCEIIGKSFKAVLDARGSE